jgi:hypothetical protein
VRIEKEEIDAVETRAADLGGRRQIEHRVEVDRRLGVGPFPDQSRPHGVVQSRLAVIGA